SYSRSQQSLSRKNQTAGLLYISKPAVVLSILSLLLHQHLVFTESKAVRKRPPAFQPVVKSECSKAVREYRYPVQDHYPGVIRRIVLRAFSAYIQLAAAA